MTLTIIFNSGKGLEFEDVTDMYEDDFEIQFNYKQGGKAYYARIMLANISGIIETK